MKITLPDVCICIWQVCHELHFSSALGFVVFSCVLVAPIVFYDFMFVLHKQTSSSLLRIFLTPPQLILVSNKLKSNPNHLGYNRIQSGSKVDEQKDKDSTSYSEHTPPALSQPNKQRTSEAYPAIRKPSVIL